MKLKPTHPLHDAIGDESGTVKATETRDGQDWLSVEFPGYGTVIGEAEHFESDESDELAHDADIAIEEAEQPQDDEPFSGEVQVVND